jgi:hypothetical protein
MPQTAAGLSERRVGIVPGGCHEESIDSRQSLQTVYDEVVRCGLSAEILPLKSFGTLPEQASLIVEWLGAHQDTTMILVSLSKGSAEVKLALRQDPAAFRHVSAWVNVSGLIYGSRWVRRLLDRPLSHVGARCWCWYWRYPFAALKQLRRDTGSMLDFEPAIPEHLRVIHVVGFPLQRHLSHPYTKRSFRRLAPLGPNDGMGIMLGDLVRTEGSVFPVWGADHFLRSPGLSLRDLVGKVLYDLARRN